MNGHVTVGTAEDMRRVGARLASSLRAGDLVLLSGELGAGKTTMAQGIGEGLGVRGPVTSPTFVIARMHPSTVGGAPMVHVDAYRIGSLDEIDALDLDATLEEAVTVVEWGEGKVEGLAADRLEVVIHRALGADPVDQDAPDGDDARLVSVTGVGERWHDCVPSVPTDLR